ncbi:MAG: histidine kinase [Nitrosospira multiformis]|nr:histidine kinase [Nitrosospira multiformis]
MELRLLTVIVKGVEDVVSVRQRARQISKLLGFAGQDQVRIATAVSEISRSICNKAMDGKAIFEYEEKGITEYLVVRIKGKESRSVEAGDADDDMVKAIDIARRLMTDCEIESRHDSGITVTLRKPLPTSGKLVNVQWADFSTQLLASSAGNSFSDIQQHNHELVELLAELKEREEDLLALTRELEDTNRGVVALYAEIEDKAKRIQHADEMKSRFLSNTSHELRTPLGSIRAISRLLLDRMDGDLTSEQEKQVKFIEEAANDLSELVNDLLDLAKIEAGKVEIHISRVSVQDFCSGLKGMLRPLATSPSVTLMFPSAEANFDLYTDEGKLMQILRNFMTNALKFTERGYVRLSITLCPESSLVRFEVSDTGIGIDPENLQLIFEEFSQIENPRQRTHKGTGLGLPLCEKLATLLKGRISVTSLPGQGSTFSLELPRYLMEEEGVDTIAPPQAFSAEQAG